MFTQLLIEALSKDEGLSSEIERRPEFKELLTVAFAQADKMARVQDSVDAMTSVSITAEIKRMRAYASRLPQAIDAFVEVMEAVDRSEAISLTVDELNAILANVTNEPKVN